jgi:dTMP kinase
MKSEPLVVKFDGIDGCGKTSLLESVRAEFSATGHVVSTTKEFGSDLDSAAENILGITFVGPHLRQIALSPEFALDDIERELLWAIISRRTNRLAIPRARLKSDVVLVDRSNLGNLAYGMTFDPRLQPVFENFVKPFENASLVYLIDTPVDECRRRVNDRGATDIIESKGSEFFEAVARNYLSLASRDSTIRVLDGSKSLIELTQIVCSDMRAKLQGPILNRAAGEA